jgi:hypothetical protein
MSDETPPAVDVTHEPSFADQAATPEPGLLWEFGQFLLYNKKWWLIPIVLVLGLLGLLVVFSSSAAAPFIYPLF